MKLLKEVLKELNIKQSEIMEVVGIRSLSTINMKLNGNATFTTKEAFLLKNYVNSKSEKQYTIEELFNEE